MASCDNNQQHWSRAATRLVLSGYKVHHAHRAHPHLHAPHHGHRHPLRLLQRHQTAPGRQTARTAARRWLLDIDSFLSDFQAMYYNVSKPLASFILTVDCTIQYNTQQREPTINCYSKEALVRAYMSDFNHG